MRYKIPTARFFEIAREFSMKLISYGSLWVVVELKPATAAVIVFKFGQVISKDKLEWDE